MTSEWISIYRFIGIFCFKADVYRNLIGFYHEKLLEYYRGACYNTAYEKLLFNLIYYRITIEEDGSEMRIAICDDDMVICSTLEKLLDNYGREQGVAIQHEIFENGRDMLAHIDSFDTFQIYLLDIEMKYMDGFEIARKIREKNEHVVIIFVTSHREMMQEAFEVQAFHYIVKPFETEEVNRIIGKAIQYANRSNQTFFYKRGWKVMAIPFHNIYYFESNQRKLNIVTDMEENEFYANIRDVKKELDERIFAQIHMSYIVNMEHIRTKTKKGLILNSGVALPISKKYATEFNEKYRNYIQMRTGR